VSPRFSGKVGSLSLSREKGTWYRALQTHFLSTPLKTAHTSTVSSRFSGATLTSPGFQVLYLAENHLVALFEVGALLGSPATPGAALPNPHSSWTLLNVTVDLKQVADLTDPAEQAFLATTAQELTGDWRGYQLRGLRGTVGGPVGLAPTQELGEDLFNRMPQAEGFLTLSAKVPYHKILVVFPQNLQPGSKIEWHNPATGNLESIP
jgi:RES domain-containing protein